MVAALIALLSGGENGGSGENSGKGANSGTEGTSDLY